MQEGYVYLIEREDGCVKIGVSVEPEKRIQTLSLQGGFMPKNQYIHGPSIEYQSIETALHKKFKTQHYIGEWFRVDIAEPMSLLKDSEWINNIRVVSKKSEKSISGENYRLYKHRDHYYIYTKGKRFSLETKDREDALNKLAGLLGHSSYLANQKERPNRILAIEGSPRDVALKRIFGNEFDEFAEMERLMLEHDRDVMLGII